MKQKKLKNSGYVNEDTKEIRNLIIITVVVIALALGLYFLTDKVLSKDTTSDTIADIDYTTCLIGNMFNRPYDEYYVFAFSSEDENASNYSSLISTYEKKDKALKIYKVDLDDNFNKSAVSETSNKKPANASDVKIKNSALIHIKNGKVVNYYESSSDYEKVLS
jgi:hypothetical protein